MWGLGRSDLRSRPESVLGTRLRRCKWVGLAAFYITSVSGLECTDINAMRIILMPVLARRVVVVQAHVTGGLLQSACMIQVARFNGLLIAFSPAQINGPFLLYS